ncbi:MAG: hypothetical protein HKN58_01335 [Xanthomonadales bacterium]|nr:hypothetical protein [Xanthomonadales bacterium]
MASALELNTVYVSDRERWRAWLEKNHDREPDGVWLVYYKQHTGKPSIDYDDSVEEALCFGWVDSLIRKLDEDRYARKFTPRKPDSQWSESNRKRVEKLLAAGLMREPGMALVEYAKEQGNWQDAPREEISESISPEFKRALAGSDAARLFFEKLTEAQRRHYILWVNQAKMEATRRRRIKESIKLLEQGRKLGMK